MLHQFHEPGWSHHHHNSFPLPHQGLKSLRGGQRAPAEAARLHEGSARCGLYLLTCWSDENADELFLDEVCDGGHDAPIGEGNGARLHVELIVSASSILSYYLVV